MISHYILDENHEPVELPYNRAGLVRWGEWFEKVANRIVKQEQAGPFFISTVFMGFDHQWNPDRAPLLFETMVFDPEGDLPRQWRYSNWQQAEAGHAHAVALMQRYLRLSSFGPSYDPASHTPAPEPGASTSPGT